MREWEHISMQSSHAEDDASPDMPRMLRACHRCYGRAMDPTGASNGWPSKQHDIVEGGRREEGTQPKFLAPCANLSPCFGPEPKLGPKSGSRTQNWVPNPIRSGTPRGAVLFWDGGYKDGTWMVHRLREYSLRGFNGRPCPTPGYPRYLP